MKTLNQTKTLSALNGLQEFKLEFLLGSVLGEVQEVEAGVSHGKEGGVGGPLNGDLDTGHPSYGNPVAAGEEQ